MNRTFVKTFRRTDTESLDLAVNTFAKENRLEILNSSLVIDSVHDCVIAMVLFTRIKLDEF